MFEMFMMFEMFEMFSNHNNINIINFPNFLNSFFCEHPCKLEFETKICIEREESIIFANPVTMVHQSIVNKMKIIDLIQPAKKTLFSFELLPPLKGQNADKLYETIDELIEYKPKYINLTTRREAPARFLFPES